MTEPKISNAQITSVSFGYEDPGALTFGIGLNIAGGGGCVFGGWALDEYDDNLGKRVCSAASMECLLEIMRVVGVNKWEDLKGQYCRIVNNGIGGIVDTIGNLMEEEWFSVPKFFEEQREKKKAERAIKLMESNF